MLCEIKKFAQSFDSIVLRIKQTSFHVQFYATNWAMNSFKLPGANWVNMLQYLYSNSDYQFLNE